MQMRRRAVLGLLGATIATVVCAGAGTAAFGTTPSDVERVDSGDTVNALFRHADGASRRLMTDIVQVLWTGAGAAMLLFTIFLAVLIVAGIGFRLGPRTPRRNPLAVFGLSALLVVGGAVVILSPSFGHRAPTLTWGAVGAARVDADRGQPAGTYQAGADTAVRYANGSSSGSGLAGTTAKSLVLYDTSGPAPSTQELYATFLANLVSHFGGWTAHPVDSYRAGEITGYDAVFYIGDPGGAALPDSFLDDVLNARKRVVWIDGDIEQLQARGKARWAGKYGFTPQGTDTTQFVRMVYKGTALTMDPSGGAGLTRIAVNDPKKATVLATAWRADGSSAPWAVQSSDLMYFSEDPLPFETQVEARNLAFADLLFTVLNARARPRHRALIRLEDVNPTTDPDQLRAIVDYLAGQQVPFSVGVFPVFRDPNGVGGEGKDVTIRLSQRPELVAALKYATTHGGSLVLHGYTHQYAAKDNPNNGRSGDDAEFYLCHLDETQQMQLDGPVPEDSEAWALGRLDQALGELQAVGLPKPSMFEFPHYMASDADYLAAGKRFDYRYERALYFPGLLSGRPADTTQPGWQFFPYAVRDVYGTTVIPENLDYVHNDDGDSVTEMLNTARSNLVVRDGVASFFYHPLLGVGQLPRLVDGIRAMGYTFVSAGGLVASS